MADHLGPRLRRSAAPRFQKPAVGRVELGDTRALYVGAPLGAGFHRGAVACLTLALDGTLAVESAAPHARTGAVTSALVGAGVRHRIDAAAETVAFVYLDPSDALVAQLRAGMRPLHALLHVEHAVATRWRRALGAGGGLASLDAPTRPARVDPRIARVLRAMRDGAYLDASVADVAAELGVSPSHFMHVFRAHAGVPFRRYRLWARLRCAVRRVAAGESFTAAALGAGFATPSHLSDAFRAMFGVAPSVLGSTRFAVAPPPPDEARVAIRGR